MSGFVSVRVNVDVDMVATLMAAAEERCQAAWRHVHTLRRQGEWRERNLLLALATAERATKARQLAEAIFDVVSEAAGAEARKNNLAGADGCGGFCPLPSLPGPSAPREMCGATDCADCADKTIKTLE